MLPHITANQNTTGRKVNEHTICKLNSRWGALSAVSLHKPGDPRSESNPRSHYILLHYLTLSWLFFLIQSDIQLFYRVLCYSPWLEQSAVRCLARGYLSHGVRYGLEGSGGISPVLPPLSFALVSWHSLAGIQGLKYQGGARSRNEGIIKCIKWFKDITSKG